MRPYLLLALVTLAALACLASARPRRRRQAHVEFRRHFYPFKEMCAMRMGVRVRDIARYMAHGLGGGHYCANFVLQCQDRFGNVSAYMEECGIGMWWSFEIGTCDIPSLTKRPECAKAICPPGNPGAVPDPRACYAFYECEAGSAFFEMCEDTSFFNPKTMSCENSATCDRPAPKTRPNGRPCTAGDLPDVCTPPGYVPSLAYCGCVHQHLEK